jgi:hypothetical protein
MLLRGGRSLEDDQSRMNRSTWGQWDWYARHRAEIEKLVRPDGRGGRICVLGAGNCNDLDLRWLAEVYSEVRLLDIDGGALERAAERQGVLGKVALEAPVDLTGISEVVASWRGRAVSSDEVARSLELVNGQSSMDNGEGRFDVVLSPCVLSQLLMGVRDVLGKEHPGWPALKAAIRARHLRTVLGMTRAGGRGVVIVDLSSTSAIAGLERAREEQWADLMRMAVRDGKCFRGLEPGELRAALGSDSVGEVRVSDPWVWHLGWGKAFLCYGLVVGKTIGG